MATKKTAKPVSKNAAAAVANFLKKGGSAPAKTPAAQPTAAQSPVVDADNDEE